MRPTIVLITHNIEEAVHLARKIAVLSQRPTSVVDVVDNPLPYPRTLQSHQTPEFGTVKNTVLTLFQKAVPSV